MLISHYAHYAYSNGEKALQSGLWPHIRSELRKREEDRPGITQAVLARVEALKAASKHKEIFEGIEG